MIKGISVSKGISMGKAYTIKNKELKFSNIKVDNVEEEMSKLDLGITKTKNQLNEIKKYTEVNIGKDKADIFEAHIMILEDPEYLQKIRFEIETERNGADLAVKKASDYFIDIFNSMDNDYMKERAVDIKDVSDRLIKNIVGINSNDISDINEEVILISEDLTPSQTSQLNKKYILGFVTNFGGQTSHTSIIARTLDIPAIVGTKNITEYVSNGDYIIVDGIKGEVYINPNDEIINKYKKELLKINKFNNKINEFKNRKSETKDGHSVKIKGNIGRIIDVDAVIENGGEGIGLFRSEFIYMDRNEFPSEEKQFGFYKEVTIRMKDESVIIRTLDIGGDKKIEYFNLEKESNPFLGLRAVRLCLKRENIFRTQLRAILRASYYGNIKIMFPMITTLNEIIKCKEILNEVKKELTLEKVPYDGNIKVGIMIEVPSAAIIADILAKEVDFFSIGTNDLCQYTLAVDRLNENIAYLYNPYNPAVIRLIKNVIEVAHLNNVTVGMCGEMASDPLATPLLLGLGLDEFSMNASSIPLIRSKVCSLNVHEAKEVANSILKINSEEEIFKYLKNLDEKSL